jgi:hypothetical protein
MTVMIDPQSVPAGDYVRLQQALVESGKWTVIDRANAYKAVKKEQEREHKSDQDRFDNARKWALWGKMYGVGGIFVGHVQCQTQYTAITNNRYQRCLQHLSIVDANTTEIISQVSNVSEGDTNDFTPPWQDTVDKFNKEFPATFKPVKYSERLHDYMNQAEEAGKKDSQ